MPAITVTSHDFSETPEHHIAMASCALISAVNELAKLAGEPKFAELLVEEQFDVHQAIDKLNFLLALLQAAEIPNANRPDYS